MSKNLLETVIGGIVLGVALFVLVFAYQTHKGSTPSGYTVSAKFDRIDGLVPGSDIRLSGVKVGTVGDLSLDPNSYLAVVTLHLAPHIQLPKDSSAEIVSDGLLGGKYMALVPGGDDDIIPAGGVIAHTQAAVSLESLIGQFIFSSQEKKE